MRSLPVVNHPLDEHHLTKGLVRITMACNERCPFCNVPVEAYAEPTPSDDHVARELDAFVASGERTLTLSGGEPTLMAERLLGVIEQARARGVPFVELQTNAILIDESYAKKLAEAGLTSAFVSLLADDAAAHDELAGLAGAFGLCLRGIDALLDSGVFVTLNPVIAQLTQQRVARYVDFVAERLPRVRSISLSVVQPHGRASMDLELLPDYALLAPQVKLAHQRAEAHGIELLNPYCGLPLCVGWDAHLARSVEAQEAASRWSRAEVSAHGIDNRGNKRHGPPCRACALRTRCGGAWHAYWTVRNGSGLQPPLARVEPWSRTAPSVGQAVLRAKGGVGSRHLLMLSRAAAPTRWVLTDVLAKGDAARLAEAGCTDLAIMTDADVLTKPGTLGDELEVLRERNRGSDDAMRLRVVIGLRRLRSFVHGFEALKRAAELEVDAVRLLTRSQERHERFVEVAKDALPQLDLSLLGTA